MCQRAKWILFTVDSRSAYTTHLSSSEVTESFPLSICFNLAAAGRVTDTDNESHATCCGIPASSSSKSVSTSFIKWKIIPTNFARPHKWCGLNSNKLCFAFSLPFHYQYFLTQMSAAGSLLLLLHFSLHHCWPEILQTAFACFHKTCPLSVRINIHAVS